MRVLLAVLLSFAFLSAEATALWGAERVRTVAFLAVLAALCALVLGRDPFLRSRDAGTLALLALLLAAIVGADALSGDVDPLDYKAALLPPLLLLAPNLATAFPAGELARTLWWLLTMYVLTTALLAAAAAPVFLVRGHGDVARVDFTGSLIAHAGLCTIYLLATLARFAESRRWPFRMVSGALAATAAVMVLLTGTRTALVTFATYLVLDAATTRETGRTLVRAGAAALATAAAVVLFSMLISDDFVRRLLAGSSEDWSSGRATSQLHWIALALEEPFGIGFGGVRELLRDGRPALDGARFLEWPHNEPLRFFVEAGLPGLAFVLLLLGHLLRTAIRAARVETRPLPRASMLAIASDMLAQSLFQNYFNSIYYATALVLVLVTLAEGADEPRPDDPVRRSRAPVPDDLPRVAPAA